MKNSVNRNFRISRHLSDTPPLPRCAALQFNDLASLVAGVKPVVYTSVRSRNDARLLDGLCADLKLKKTVLGTNRNVYDAPVVDVLIGTNAEKLQAAEKAYGNVLSPEWGFALGYPECCVKSYIDWNTKKADTALIRHIYARSPEGTVFPFWMNNVFNYYSRLSRPEDRRRYAAFTRLNEGVDREAVIPWHPCSYLCAETVRKGKLIYETLERHMPVTAAFRKALLSKPVLFWDDFVFAVLDGRCRKTARGFSAAGKGLCRPQSLLAPETVKSLAVRKTFVISPRGKITGPADLRLPGNHIFLPFAP